MPNVEGRSMPLEIVTVPCLRDNYAYLLRDAATGKVGLVDAPEPGPIEAALGERGWGLDLILITHHHGDHIDGVDALRRDVRREGGRGGGGRPAAAGARHRARCRRPVALGESRATVIDVPGPHDRTYRLPLSGGGGAVLGRQPDGDGLRPAVRGHAGADVVEPHAAGGAAGCDAGLFGPRIRRSNARFALSVDGGEPGAQARGRRRSPRCGRWARPTVPARLDLERATNPFLRAPTPDFKARLGLEKLPDAQVFAEIRRRKDAF